LVKTDLLLMTSWAIHDVRVHAWFQFVLPAFVLLYRRSVNPEAVQKMKRRGVHIKTLVGNPSSSTMLRQAQLDKADGVILGGLEQLDPKVADTQVGGGRRGGRGRGGGLS
jgi:hypothetical protein